MPKHNTEQNPSQEPPNKKNKKEHKTVPNIEKKETKCNDLTTESIKIEPTTSTTSEVVIKSTTGEKQEFNFWRRINKQGEHSTTSSKKSIKISEINEGKFMKTDVTIRLTYKSEVRETSVGPVLSFHGIDETGEIAFIVFGNHSTTAEISNLTINKIYSIQNFIAYKEDPNYPSGTSNPLQIRINSNTVITEICNEINFTPIPFNFTQLNEISHLQKNVKIDVLGILIKKNDLEINKKGSTFRDIILTDMTKEEVSVTLWNNTAEHFECENFTPIAIKRTTVTEFNGKIKLNCLSGTLIWCKPENLQPANSLLEWFKKEIADVSNLPS